MKWASTLFNVGLLSSTATTLAFGQGVQISTGADVAKRDAIKAEFIKNWQGYVKFAQPKDKLAPIAKTGSDDPNYGGKSGTILDTLSTLIAMGLENTPEYKDALEVVKKLDYTTTQIGYGEPGELSIFEMTVRHMAGLLSAYQMNGEKPKERFLVTQAQSLADTLSVGWYGKNKIPFNEVNLLKKAPQDIKRDANIAEATSLTLEWTLLSKYVGNPKYANLAQGAVQAVLDSKPHFPHIWTTRINPNTNLNSSDYITLGGGYDSFIECVLKLPVLLGQADHPYAKEVGNMIDAIKDKLIIKTGVKGLKFTADFNTKTNDYSYVSSHLACFLGGQVSYAGKLHNRKDWLKLGLELTESCYMTFRNTATGVAPYAFGYFDQKGEAKGWGFIPTARREAYNKHGFFVNVPMWLARPEIIEGLFYSWRTTGKQIWRDYAWEAFLAMQKYAGTETAWAGIVNVNDPSTGLYDQTESLVYSEIFKYLYLIFDDSKNYSLDEYMFTTRGHILKRGSAATNAVPAKTGSSMTKKRQNNKGQYHPVQTVNDAYNSILESKEEHVPCSLQSGVKPEGVFYATPGGTRKEYVESLSSLLGVDPKAAYAMLAGIPVTNNTIVAK